MHPLPQGFALGGEVHLQHQRQDIGLQMRLTKAWNGRFFHQVSGGTVGNWAQPQAALAAACR